MTIDRSDRTGDKRLFHVVCFVGFLLGMDNGGLQFVLLKIADEFCLSKALMGGMMTVQFAGLAVAAVVAGFLADKIGKKRIALISSMSFAVSTFLCFLGISGFMVVIGIFGCGASFGALEVSVCAALSDAYGKKAGRYLLIMQGALGLGSVACPLIASFMMNVLGSRWNEMFLLCSVLFFIAFLFILYTEFRHENVVVVGNGDEGKFSIKNMALVGLLLCGLIYGGLETGVGSFIDTYFVTVVNRPEYSATTLSLFWAAIGIARLMAGMLYKHRGIILIIAFTFAGVLYILMGKVDTVSLSMFITIAIGIFIGPVLPTLVSIINEKCPQNTGITTSFMNAASGIGSSVAPPVVGAVAEISSLSSAFCGLGVLAFIGTAVYLTTAQRKIQYGS